MSDLLTSSAALASMHQATTLESTARRSIPDLVHDLLRGLTEISRQKAIRSMKRSLRRYRDAEFNYIEIALPGLEGVEADICVHDGCIYVRMAR